MQQDGTQGQGSLEGLHSASRTELPVRIAGVTRGLHGVARCPEAMHCPH